MEKITISNRIAHLSAAEQRLYHALPLVLLGDAEPPAITVSLTDVWFEDRLGDWVVAYRLGLQQETRIVVSEIRKVDRSGVFRPDAKDPAPKQLMMPTDVAARKLVAAIEARKKEKVITLHGKLAVLAQRFAPVLLTPVLKTGKSLSRG